jgi:hypothetical protein
MSRERKGEARVNGPYLSHELLVSPVVHHQRKPDHVCSFPSNASRSASIPPLPLISLPPLTFLPTERQLTANRAINPYGPDLARDTLPRERPAHRPLVQPRPIRIPRPRKAHRPEDPPPSSRRPSSFSLSHERPTPLVDIRRAPRGRLDTGNPRVGVGVWVYRRETAEGGPGGGSC